MILKHKKLIWQLYASVLLIVFVALLASVIYVFFIFSGQNWLYQDVLEGSLCIAVLSAVVTYFVSRKITRPLEELKEMAEQVASGQAHYRLPLSESYEISALIQAINAMVTQMEDRVKVAQKERNEKEAILNSMMEGVICVDLNERITSVNPAAIRFLGQEESNIINESIQSVIRHTDLQKFISQVLGGCNPEKEGIVIQDRSARYLWVHGTPLLTPRGQVVAAVIVLQDVTQIKHLETVKKDFVANVSHELKTPVTLIKGFIETLQDGIDASPEEQTRFLGIIKTHADRLDAIIDDLLTLSRLEQYDQHQDVGFEAVSLQNVIKESIESCQVKAHEKHIQIHWEPESNLFVQGNYHLILQALVNLIDNAIKYSSESTQVSILVSQTKENGIIAVSDQGVGIPKEDISRVFERFYRVDKARSRKEGGTGLGLAIVKHIAQVHNGWVEVQSQPGFGSVFSIFLPLANEA